MSELEESLETHKKMTKLKNRWKKDTALLQQDKDLLAQQVQELRDKEYKLKKTNIELQRELENDKQESFRRTKKAMNNLMKENIYLQSKIERYMAESREKHQEKCDLKNKKESIEEKYLETKKEKEGLAGNYNQKIRELEKSFDNFKHNNEK